MLIVVLHIIGREGSQLSIEYRSLRVAAFLAIEQVLQLNVDYIDPHNPIEVETALLAQALQQNVESIKF